MRVRRNARKSTRSARCPRSLPVLEALIRTPDYGACQGRAVVGPPLVCYLPPVLSRGEGRPCPSLHGLAASVSCRCCVRAPAFLQGRIGIPHPALAADDGPVAPPALGSARPGTSSPSFCHEVFHAMPVIPEGIAYAYTHETTQATTGYFSCQPPASLTLPPGAGPSGGHALRRFFAPALPAPAEPPFAGGDQKSGR